MSKTKIGIILILLIVTILATVRILSGEDGWICESGGWVRHGNPSAPKPLSLCNAGEQPDIDKRLADIIQVDYPKANDAITSPVTITGKARGNWYFEASFPVVLVDWDGLIIGQGIATAKVDPDDSVGAGWMTTEFVLFEAKLEFKKPTYKNTGTLILKKDNPSGLPANDAALEIPVLFK